MIRHRPVLDAVRDAIFLADIDTGMIVDANRAAESLSGRSLAELRLLHHTQLHPHEAAGLASRGFEKDAQVPGLTEGTVLHKDGRRIPVEIASSHFTAPHGRRMLLGVFRDTTERIAAREDLRRSEERFRQVAESAGEYIWEVDATGLYLYASPVVEQILGYTPEEIVGKMHFYDLFVPETREEIKKAAFDTFARQEPFRAFLNWNVRKDGRIVALETSGVPVHDSDGGFLGYRGADTDVTERIQAEAALREGEERFRNLADTAPVLIWVSGPDKLCTFFNKPWLDFTGRTLEQELGNGWATGVHPDDLDRCLATYSSSFDARRSFQMEYRMRRADGEYRWVLDSGAPRYREGEFTGFIGSCIDVTGQKLLEERLRASEARLMDAQRLAKIGSWDLDVETNGIHWSDEMFRIYGLRNGAQPDFPALLSHVHHKDRNIILEAQDQALSSLAPVDVEFRIIRPDGDIRFVRSIVEAIKNDRGAPVRFVGATQDITDQVHARDFLRESEKSLRHAERLAHVGNWHWDIGANRVTCSEETLRILGSPQGYTPAFEGFLQAVVPQDRERVHQWGSDCLAEKSVHSIEFQIARSNGDLRTVVCTSEVVLDEDGLPASMIGACQDVTESRRAQNEAFGRQKLESVGTLARGIAHDFNNLLGGVLAHADLALAELAAGLHAEEELQRIRDVAIQGAEIVRQLMVYAGKESEVLELVDVSQVVSEMIQLLKVSVSKHAALVTDLSRNLPAVQANAAQLRQIVMNLVTNASEAIGDRDGVIRVTTGSITLGRATAISKGVAEGDYLQLEVSDTGGGMPLETQARAFDPFFTTKSTGRGLGLAVVHGIVRNLRGVIHLASEPDKGTTFQILLPSAGAGAGASAGPVPRADEAAGPSREATLLVVEDEDSLRQPVAKLLRKRGFEVLEAADGSVAIDLLRANGGRIDAILLDMTIPGPSSHEVLAEAEQARPDLKVILTSAYSEEMVTATMSSPLVRGFIRKPFQLGDLLQTIRKVLSS